MEKWSLYFTGKEYTGHNLTLVNVRKNDTGDVLCIADNKIPSAVSHKFELTIHCKFFIQWFSKATITVEHGPKITKHFLGKHKVITPEQQFLCIILCFLCI